MVADRELIARRELSWLCERGLDWQTLVDQASEVIRRVVPHERFCFHTLDPATMLITGGAARNLDNADGYRLMVRNEYEQEDVNKWASLARSEHRVGSLSVATDGRREQSPRFVELLRPMQLAWELRAALVSDSLCWAVAGIYRSDGERDFSEQEQDFLAGVSSTLGTGFRRALLVESLAPQEELPDDPGLVLLDNGDQVVEVAPAAEPWLDELRGGGQDSDELLPVEVYAAAAAARSGADAPAASRVRTRSGRWLSVHGVRLSDSGRTAVIIQPARAPEVAPLILDSYGLTGRERAICELALKGLSTNQIAASLHISPYTVQDHLKAIFEKVGVRSRRELVARVFFQHHLPRIQAGESPGPDGSFRSLGISPA